MTAKRTKFKTKGEARVAIAKDVLKWIDAEEIQVGTSEYVYNPELISKEDLDTNADLRKKLKGQRKDCQVCALGAAFLAAVDRFNKVGCSDVITQGEFIYQGEHYNNTMSRMTRRSVTSYLNKFFSPTQLNLIEIAFEQSTGPIDGDQGRELFMKALDFSYNYDGASENDSDRLKRIMNNIVRNKGTFKP